MPSVPTAARRSPAPRGHWPSQSRIPASHLTLVNRQGSYAHNDPAAAYPKNAFFNNLMPVLGQVGLSAPGG